MSSVASHHFDDYESLLVLLQNALGIVVTDAQRSSLLARIEPLLSSNNLESIAELTQGLRESGELKSILLEALSLHDFSWDLSSDIKVVLHDYIFPQLPEKAKICIVGCGQGQLAYSVAMEIAEYESRNTVVKKFQVFATDSAEHDLKIAEAALYTEQQLESLGSEYRNLYVAASNATGMFKIKDKIHQTVSFLQYNLATDSIPGTVLPNDLDLIICPEALVYFTSNDKAKIILQLSERLKSGGIFLTGNNQSIAPQAVMSDDCILELVAHPSGDFYRRVN